MVPDDDEKASQVDLVDEDSCMVFHILNMDGGWLSATPKQWHESAEYRELCSFVASLKVTIDTAERGVGSLDSGTVGGSNTLSTTPTYD